MSRNCVTSLFVIHYYIIGINTAHLQILGAYSKLFGVIIGYSLN